MRTLVKALLFAMCMASGCSTVGCCGAVVNHNACGLQAGTANVPVTGTFTDSATGVSGTIGSGTTIFVERESSGGTTVSTVTLSGETLNFTSPNGASGSLSIGIELSAAPSTGTITQSSSGIVSGSLDVEVSSATVNESYTAATAWATGSSWSLDFTSASQFCGTSDVAASVSEYTVHGTLNATMVTGDSPPKTGTLSLSF